MEVLPFDFFDFRGMTMDRRDLILQWAVNNNLAYAAIINTDAELYSTPLWNFGSSLISAGAPPQSRVSKISGESGY